MKKYIKIKDKILEVHNYIEKNKTFVCNWKATINSIGAEYIKEWKIESSADSIEELCDAFYVDTNYCYADDYDLFAKDLWRLPTLDTMVQETKKYLYKDFPSDDEVDKYLSQEVTYALYGMVKTDKGFTYVAKLHNDGKWKLL